MIFDQNAGRNMAFFLEGIAEIERDNGNEYLANMLNRSAKSLGEGY